MSNVHHPRYQQIAGELRAELTTGLFPPNTHIGTEATLSDRFDVNRTTIGRALDILKREGLVVSRRSTGIFTAPLRVQVTVARHMLAAMDPHREHATLGPWETALRAHNLTGHGRVHDVRIEHADSHIAELLKVDAGTRVVVRYRNPTIDGVGPAQLQRAFMPYERVKDTALARSGDILGGVYAYMTTVGIQPAWFTEEVAARVGTDAELTILDRPAGSVVIEAWRVTHDNNDKPIEALRIVADAGLVKFAYHQSLA